MTLHYADGSQDHLNLFLPWEHWEHERKYMTADFKRLQNGLRAQSSSMSQRDRRVYELD